VNALRCSPSHINCNTQHLHTNQLHFDITSQLQINSNHHSPASMTSMKRSSDAMEPEPVDPHNQIIDIPNNLEVRIKFINQEILRAVQPLCLASRKANGIPDATSEPTKSLLPRLEAFLRWLETSVEITPALKQGSKIASGLELMFKKPEFHFEDRTRERAQQLYEKWEAQNWGKGEVMEESTDDESLTGSNDEPAPEAKRRRSSSGAQGSENIIVPGKIRAPPASHPIFGEHGIMHGVVLKISSRRKGYILDSRYQKHDAKVFGHNGLEVGQWWPTQLLALFNGAHGGKIAGISGHKETGAYSVVTSGGAYEELDEDRGNTLYYSRSRSHDNKDPKKPFPSSDGTLALKASQRTRNPVRVLRAAGTGGSKSGRSLRPTVGIRYDGLYLVQDMQLRTNMNGGLYEQFKLVRLDGQPDLNNKARPTAAEIRDFYEREKGY
jgi:hypothetical protein